MARLIGGDSFREQAAQLLELKALRCGPSPAIDSEVPRIGILVTDPADLHPSSNYLSDIIAAVIAAGGQPILIPPRADLMMPGTKDGRAQGIRDLLADLDGLIGPGGDDVDPKLYGEWITHAQNTHLARDRFEHDLLRQAAHLPLFIVAICRSHQLLNVALRRQDGPRPKLSQDVQKDGLSTYSQNQSHFGIPGDQPLVIRDDSGTTLYSHDVYFDGWSDMAALIDRPDQVPTNSFRHQAVGVPSLTPVARVYDPVTGRATIEATEGWNIFSAQFHPERHQDQAWAQALLNTAVRRGRLFRVAKRLRAAGLPATTERLGEYTRAHPDRFEPADLEWLRVKLGPRLRRGLVEFAA